MLYSVWQRYNFESNLQHLSVIINKDNSCIQYDKDTILKAIYNSFANSLRFCSLYSVWQRYNFESNLQRQRSCVLRVSRCIQYDKDTILKAIYNMSETVILRPAAVFSMTKIQFWKQFTTGIATNGHRRMLYSVWQRYNFESNLQPLPFDSYFAACCIQYDKDTILKAIYNTTSGSSTAS